MPLEFAELPVETTLLRINFPFSNLIYDDEK
jgi:hypothetical protein